MNNDDYLESKDIYLYEDYLYDKERYATIQIGKSLDEKAKDKLDKEI